MNEAELSLGLGTLVGSDERTVRIDFGAIGETRTYARESAALSRARFEIGDRLRRRDSVEITVQAISEEAELITYQGVNSAGEAVGIHEMELSDFTQLNRANQRLFAGQVDRPQFYQLRQSARQLNDVIAHSETRGLTSGRTSLIPHQLFIADEVARRQSPRVLLADEVGLGKTIEAGLILNSRLISGEDQRVLVIVPEHLINQWLVEMLRRFNLKFSLYDEARCRADSVDQNDSFLGGLFDEEEGEEGLVTGTENPFEAEQLVLCSIDLFDHNPDIHQQALDAGWDMLVVDEAHHLEWSPESASSEYQVVEQFAEKIDSVLLLTATPEQLGKEGHFARLRLLDPARFFDYEKYLAEEQGYIATAEAIDLLEADPDSLKDSQWAQIENELVEPELVSKLAGIRQAASSGTQQGVLRSQLINDLLDRHGTGRLLFRNTRSAIQGFPQRQLHCYELQQPDEYRSMSLVDDGDWRAHLTPETSFTSESQDKKWTDFDPRISWLFEFLKEKSPQKVLVIAAKAETALDISEALRVKTGMAASVFHEHMSIIERDRAAAFFADEEYGAQCLICSEIGSEGRNFQFAHNMVLFDLPANPDLLEQRIGRLDRIGQTETINIHVPFMQESAQAQLLDIYHNSLDAFEHTGIAALPVLKQLEDQFEAEMAAGELSEELLGNAKNLRLVMEEELHQGRDRLLERNSCKMDVAQELVDKAQQSAKNTQLADFVQSFADNYGIAYEQQSNGSCVMRPTESMTSAINGLPDEGLTLTYDRAQALANEDMQFFTWDHPVVVSALDAVLTSELGNTTVVTMKVRGIKPGSMMLESIFVLETPGNRYLQASRYLPSSRIRVMLDQSGRSLEKLTEKLIDANQQRVKRHIGAQIAKARRSEIQALLKKATDMASNQADKIRHAALAEAEEKLGYEIARMEALQKVNPSVHEAEVQAIKQSKDKLLDNLQQTELSLDALRLVVFT